MITVYVSPRFSRFSNPKIARRSRLLDQILTSFLQSPVTLVEPEVELSVICG